MRLLPVFFAFSFLAPAIAAPKGDPAQGKILAEKNCAACHMADGNSAVATYPSLAGQHPEYMVKQLMDFKSGARKNQLMLGITATLSEKDMANVAAWMSSQPAKERSASDKTLIEAGRKIYRNGIAAKGVPACMSCHSPNGAGIPGQYPRLASQHSAYTIAQLNAFRSGERNNQPIMPAIAELLTDKEIKALAEYLQALH